MSSKHFRAALLSSAFVLIQPAFAQNLPGTAIDTTTVAAEIQTLLTLAQQAYPSSIPSASASGWRLYSGYTFKYFSATGIYVGIKDGQVYLLGGPYTSITPYGAIAAVTSALQTRIANMPNPNTPAVADFSSYLAARTLSGLMANFSMITMEYGAGAAAAQIKLEVLGQETINGTSTEQLKVTISSAAGTLQYDMWVDSAGIVLRLRSGTYEYLPQQANLIGPTIVSGFLIALSAGDQPQVKAALANEIQNPALSTRVTKRIVGNTELDTVQITVASGGVEIMAYISDFGSFSMTTEYSAKIGSLVTNAFEIVDMKLR